jgi:hypothetical protein
MKRPEQSLQRQIIRGLRLGFPPGWVIAAIPNGGGRTKIEGAILKGQGVLAGMPDIIICGCRHFDETSPLAEPVPVCAFLELKAGKGRLTAVQHDIHDRLKALGHAVAVVRSLEDAARCCQDWNLPLKVSV